MKVNISQHDVYNKLTKISFSISKLIECLQSDPLTLPKFGPHHRGLRTLDLQRFGIRKERTKIYPMSDAIRGPPKSVIGVPKT